MSVHGRAFTAVKWTAVDSAFSQAFSLLVFLLIARLLGPEDFGTVAVASGLLGVLSIFVGFGLATAIVQSDALEEAQYHTAFTLTFGSGVTVSLLLFVTANPVAQLFREPELAGVLTAMACIPCIRSLGIIPAARLTRHLDFKSLAIRNIFSTLISGAIGVGCALSGRGLYSLVVMHLCHAMLETVFVLYLTGDRPRLMFHKRHALKMLRFGRAIVSFEIISEYNRRSPVLFAGYFLGPQVAGILSVSIQILTALLAVFIQAFNKVAIPYFARLKHDERELLDAFYAFTSLAAMIALPVFTGFAIVAPSFAAAFLGDQWSTAPGAMQLVVLVGLVQGISFFNGGLLVALGAPQLRIYAVAFRAIVGTLLFSTCHGLGLLGMALAYLVRGVAAEPIQFYFVNGRIPAFELRQFLANISRFFVYSAIMAAGVKGFEVQVLQPMVVPDLVALAAQVCLGLTIYVCLMLLLERQQLQELLERFRS